jgi:hypothetical protein
MNFWAAKVRLFVDAGKTFLQKKCGAPEKPMPRSWLLYGMQAYFTTYFLLFMMYRPLAGTLFSF